MAVVSAGTVPYLIWFVLLAIGCAVLYYRTTVTSNVAHSAEFKKFQRIFLVVYLVMVMADWLQGPYVYALYKEYGFSTQEIGQLFVVGFGSSLVFGTIVGGFADKYGRKLNCLLFALLYGISCATKHFNSFGILMVGRLLGGVATSILMSAFETWMIHEHRHGAFPEDWMSSTFSQMTFGGSLSAILAGLVAWALAAQFGSVAPFDASMTLLAAGGVMIVMWWRENYGEAQSPTGAAAGALPSSSSGGGGAASSVSAALASLRDASESFVKAGRLLVTNERVLLLGVIQSCFESAMYIFVFMWTPALEGSLAASYAAATAGSGSGLDGGKGAASVEDGADPLAVPAAGDAPRLPHGIVFALFMVAVMIGSKIFESLVAARPVEDFARWMFVVASAALAMPILTDNHSAQLLAFCVFEACCGVYFPSVGTMRSRYIPEEVRSTVMNIFRIGLNLIVVLTLTNVDAFSQDTIFMFTVLLLCLAVLAQHRLMTLSDRTAPSAVAVGPSAANEDAPRAHAVPSAVDGIDMQRTDE